MTAAASACAWSLPDPALADDASLEWFDVPADADEDFLAAWTADGRGGTLLRAIRADAACRFVALIPGAPGYELVREDGSPDVEGGVVLVHACDAPPDDLPAGRRGYLGSRLYRRLDGAGFVEVARWSSPLMVF